MTIRFRLPVALALPLAYIAAAGAQPTARPNIVYIMSDDHAYQAISAYGSSVSKLAPTPNIDRSEEHTSELPSLMRISYAVFCLKKKNKKEFYVIRNESNTRPHQIQ